MPAPQHQPETTAAEPVTTGRAAARRSYAAVSAALLITGSALFSWGGSQHPPTGSSMGPIGSSEYFRTFAEEIATAQHWHASHAALLAAPLLWALGGVGLLRHPSAVADPGFGQLGRVALSIGATAWAVVFVIDGFVSPLQATRAAEGGFTSESLEPFRDAQEIVARLGLVSWLLLGAGVAAIATASWLTRTSGIAARLLFVSGLVVGLWPLLGWAIGEFRPTVFTSGPWGLTALVTALWFAVAGVLVVWWELRDA